MSMRTVCLLAVLTACDLQPPKPKAAPPALAPSDAAVVIVLDADAAPLPIDAGATVDARLERPPADAGVEVTDACLEVGEQFATSFIATATDLAERSAADRDRARMVRKMAELCTTQTWSADKRGCWIKASTRADHQRCAEMN
ncbi:MAG: hypothetical protein WKG01_33785 [Kofleriaceae bacterium]